MHTTLHPSASDALQFIKEHHSSKPEKTLLLVMGECMVDYHGRAKSLLDWGERLIMIKQDGTVLVHQPVMREPVNWQPTGSITEFNTKDDLLIINCRHLKPPEKMKVTFRQLKLVTATSLVDRASLVIAGMEIDVVNQIVNDPAQIEEGLRIVKREKPVKTGSIDLYGFDKNHIPVVIEVKRSLATISSVHQLRMYVTDIKKDRKEPTVRGILCAPRVPDMVKKLLEEHNLEWREVERKIILPDNRQKTLKEF
ncbi:MAG: endonuclease NucS [Candidatus Thermoplasmatota archaeon]|nr:endonuclease NucS [Candidatus Thermoplasmatota archaeon]